VKSFVSDVSPLKLRILLMENGITQAEIARSLRITPQSVHQVIDGRFVSHRVREAISEAVGKDLNILWPNTYLYGGGPRKRGRPLAEETKKRATARHRPL